MIKEHVTAGALALLTASLVLLLAGAGRADAGKDEKFDYENFDNPTRIDNPWMPMTPGTRLIYAGSDLDDEGAVRPHRIEVHVTDLVKLVDGIRSVVSWDLDYAGDELLEAELAFYAQDNDGTVWRMGEHPEEYEDGKVVESPGWMAGIQGAKAGIAMPAKPKAGASYAQGWAPAVEFTDRARIDGFEKSVSTPIGRFENVLVIAETSEDEGPDAEQLKLYARGIGEIRVGWRGEGEQNQEVLELVRVQALSPEAVADVRARALDLEKHAYQISPEVYGQTLPSQPTSEAIAWASIQKHREKMAKAATAALESRKITEADARAIALEAVPGTVTDVKIERKLGVNAIVVEVIAASDMSETDVIIHPETGEVLGTEK